MKKIIYCAILISFVQSGLSGQSCLPGGIVFSSQASIDASQINIPVVKT